MGSPLLQLKNCCYKRKLFLEKDILMRLWKQGFKSSFEIHHQEGIDHQEHVVLEKENDIFQK